MGRVVMNLAIAAILLVALLLAGLGVASALGMVEINFA